ncbi:MAG: FN3 associated domain-containing protein, partial [Planctomycetota bacterium]
MPVSVKTSLLSMVLIAFLADSTVAKPQLAGDLNQDYKVDFKDLRAFALQWLDPICLAPGCLADLDDADGVNMADFALLANNWKMVESHIVINEFMASNINTRLDGDGQSSDWIEIYNPSDTVVNLDGWYLTDYKPNLTKWQFPDGLEVKAGEFLLVFASEKTYELYPNNYPYLDSSGYYHTNFNLDKEPGEYLALVAPDGNTIIHEYAPEYPTQLADISYGLAQYATTLVPIGATTSYHVPTINDAALGTDWTDVNFDDSSWDTGPTSIGFGDVGGAAGTILREYWTGIDGPSVSDLTNNSNYPDNPSGSSEPTIFEAPLDWADDYGTRMHGFLHPPTSGDYTFWISSDDNSELWLSTDDNPANANLIAQETGWSNTRVWETGNEQSAPITLVGGQRYYIKALQKEDGGGDNLAVTWGGPGIVMGEPIDGQYLSPWTGGYVSTDVQADMMGVNASLWARIEFNLEEGENGLFDTMKLRIKYEDGFVAYLNGQEVARRRAPSPVQWNSTADSNRPIGESSIFEEINLMAYLYLLQSGKNVLAFHGLNDNQNNGDFLILPEMVAARNQAVPQYFTTATPETFNIPGAIGRVGEVWFSNNRGFHETAFPLNLYTGSNDAQIRYTLDGSQPTITHGNIYSSPININTTTIIRAVAVKPGWLDSAVETHTYIFLNDVIYQTNNPLGFPSLWGGTAADYEMDPEIVNVHTGTIKNDLKSIPTMSLVTHVDDMFGPSGIYSNPSGTGFTWERAGSIELIYPSGSEGFQVDCGVRIYGGAFRDNWGLTRKKTFRLLFKGIYGATKLRYPLFGEDAADEFDTIILRGGANDAWNGWGRENTQYIVDEFMRRTQLALGHPSGHGTFVHLYVNGLYWGLYNPVERPQSSFAA